MSPPRAGQYAFVGLVVEFLLLSAREQAGQTRTAEYTAGCEQNLAPLAVTGDTLRRMA